MGFPGSTRDKEPARQYRRHKSRGFDPWVGKSPWRRAWQTTPVFLPGNPMDRGAWQATVHGVGKSRTQVARLSTHIPLLTGSLYLLTSISLVLLAPPFYTLTLLWVRHFLEIPHEVIPYSICLCVSYPTSHNAFKVHPRCTMSWTWSLWRRMRSHISRGTVLLTGKVLLSSAPSQSHCYPGALNQNQNIITIKLIYHCMSIILQS